MSFSRTVSLFRDSQDKASLSSSADLSISTLFLSSYSPLPKSIFPSTPIVLPPTIVVNTTSVKLVVTITLLFAILPGIRTTQPKAIAPLIRPAKAIKVNSLHLILLAGSFF